MSLMNVFDVSGSAMSAQSVRLNAIASNMANANAAHSSEGKVYKAKHPIFQTVLKQNAFDDNKLSRGVKISGVHESEAPVLKKHQPTHPMANDEGFVYFSNVNMIEEMTNMTNASHSMRANIEAISSAKRLLMSTLSIGQ